MLNGVKMNSLMLSKLARDRGGSILVEFAICLPVLLTMYLGAYVISDLVDCNRKTTVATRALVDLASHNLSPIAIQLSPATTSATAYLGASALVLTPYSMANATETISLLRVCDATHGWVVWSQTQTQTSTGTVLTSPITVGTPAAASVVAIPASLVTSPMIPVNPNGTTGICSNYNASNATLTQVGQAGGYVFAGQINYQYSAPLGYGSQTSIPLSDIVYMSPRLN